MARATLCASGGKQAKGRGGPTPFAFGCWFNALPQHLSPSLHKAGHGASAPDLKDESTISLPSRLPALPCDILQSSPARATRDGRGLWLQDPWLAPSCSHPGCPGVPAAETQPAKLLAAATSMALAAFLA